MADNISQSSNLKSDALQSPVKAEDLMSSGPISIIGFDRFDEKSFHINTEVDIATSTGPASF